MPLCIYKERTSMPITPNNLQINAEVIRRMFEELVNANKQNPAINPLLDDKETIIELILGSFEKEECSLSADHDLNDLKRFLICNSGARNLRELIANWVREFKKYEDCYPHKKVPVFSLLQLPETNPKEAEEWQKDITEALTKKSFYKSLYIKGSARDIELILKDYIKQPSQIQGKKEILTPIDTSGLSQHILQAIVQLKGKKCRLIIPLHVEHSWNLVENSWNLIVVDVNESKIKLAQLWNPKVYYAESFKVSKSFQEIETILQNINGQVSPLLVARPGKVAFNPTHDYSMDFVVKEALKYKLGSVALHALVFSINTEKLPLHLKRIVDSDFPIQLRDSMIEALQVNGNLPRNPNDLSIRKTR